MEFLEQGLKIKKIHYEPAEQGCRGPTGWEPAESPRLPGAQCRNITLNGLTDMLTLVHRTLHHGSL
jgi:hypothetical protein